MPGQEDAKKESSMYALILVMANALSCLDQDAKTNRSLWASER